MFLSAFRCGRIPREIVFAVAKGMYGRSRRCFKIAVKRVMKDLDHTRRLKGRRPSMMRTLWITRINPASREHGLVYSFLIGGLKRSQVHLDRKMLCNLAETEPVSFKCVVDEAKRVIWPVTGKNRDLTGF
mmetsp:Transcript_42317/g.76766  ORF Transcript_42317/g.76766 Transcript_42317/m.76766 type:complete len:130 (-) Transcript_42317:137-526(-)